MTPSSPFNPYETPTTPPPPSESWDVSQGLQYIRSVSFIFESPNWVVNVLLLAACLFTGYFIPVLPMLVLVGYQCELMDWLVFRSRERYPDFDINRIMDYLVRGLWPVLVAILVSIVSGLVLLLVLGIPIGLLIALVATLREEDAAIAMVVLVPGIVFVALTFGLAINVALVPFVLRAVWTQGLEDSFNVKFARDFVRRVWLECLLAGLFLIGVALLAQFVGMLLFCIGLVLTMPIIYFTQAHLAAQLYLLFVSRGGERIPVKQPPAAVDAPPFKPLG